MADNVKSYGYLLSLDIFDDFYDPKELTEFLADMTRGALINVENIEYTLMGELTKEEPTVND